MPEEQYPGGSRGRVNKAGENVRRDEATEEDLAVIDTWRAAHAYILNTFQATLRNRTRNLDTVVAQRLKRKSTIFGKLLREKRMLLSRMDDIAGCRLIFGTIAELQEFRTKFHSARFKHKLRNSPEKYDYIQSPKPSGYRGIHDVYEYNVGSIGGKKYNGLLIELQYRTNYQHAWATSVEVVGFITENQPKFNQGDERYKEFFMLCSEIISRNYEGMRSCLPQYCDNDLIDRFRHVDGGINLLRTLKGINSINRHISDRKNVILVFRGDSGLTVHTYDTSPEAIRAYFDLEKKEEGGDIVLVRADSGEDIRSAFRNYFSDTNDFVGFIENGCEKLASGA